MRVLLVRIDGRMPNLALMKLSAWHKALGDQVGLHIQSPDTVYISVIFKQNYPQAQGVVNFYPLADCFLGGPGLDEPNTLGAIIGRLEIDDVMPDYSLFNCDFSMGFTMRGCSIQAYSPSTEEGFPSEQYTIIVASLMVMV